MAPTKPVTLALASFMDSPERQALPHPEEDVRKIVGRFLQVCYEDIGIEPKQLDGHDIHGALGHVLPRRFEKGDPLADSAPDVLRAYLKHLEETEVLSNSFELKKGFESTLGEFQDTVRTGVNHHHHAPKEPFQHNAEKLGRNDPCSCGSGKKFKKCHGKG